MKDDSCKVAVVQSASLLDSKDGENMGKSWITQVRSGLATLANHVQWQPHTFQNWSSSDKHRSTCFVQNGFIHEGCFLHGRGRPICDFDGRHSFRATEHRILPVHDLTPNCSRCHLPTKLQSQYLLPSNPYPSRPPLLQCRV